MPSGFIIIAPDASRSPHGERGLKYICKAQVRRILGRSPHGERGLKCKYCNGEFYNELVALLTESVD